jgi:hypothetical protein
MAVLLVLAAAPAVTVTTARASCGDPCFQAARGAHRNCVSSTQGAFLDAVDACLERDQVCVDACRMARQDCRDATSLSLDLAACQVEVEASKERCRASFRVGSARREDCIDRAQIEGFRCRRRAAHDVRKALRECRSSFTRCATGCSPGGPPEGVAACRADGKRARRAAVGACRTTFRVTASACVGRDVTCVQACGDSRDACNAPTQATLDEALASCATQRNAAVAACRVEHPGGGTAFEQCIQTAQADAFACRDTALESAAAGFGACTATNLSCVEACPPA